MPTSARTLLALGTVAALGATAFAPALTGAGPTADTATTTLADARAAEPVVVTGDRVADWSVPAATGQPATFPAGGSSDNPVGDQVRSAHHGTVVVPPGSQDGGVPVGEVAAFRWDGDGWTEVPVQVDERFPHFLANGRSDFGFYSGVDTELTYAWGGDGTHTVGEEAWKKVAGQCLARYPADEAEVQALIDAGVITLGDGETASDMLGAMADPVPGLDHDDEIAFNLADAGPQAPVDAPAPDGASARHDVVLADPLDPAAQRVVSLFRRDGGSSFTHDTGYVDHQRAEDADRWLTRDMWDPADPEKLGTSNTGYGANLPGTTCGQLGTAADDLAAFEDEGEPALQVRDSQDRFPADTMRVRTAAYELGASGRWMLRSMRVADPEQTPGARSAAEPGALRGTARFAPRAYGPDLVDRWKGRAFQQSPDSSVSLVGFEDEQVNWEANSSLLGWRSGPVRTIREIWGADSGTNVTKTETFWRDVVWHRYRVRVHPIPPDGLYTSWDYNRDVAETYYTAVRPEGVPVDGVNDDVGNVDEVAGRPAFFDAPDPTLDLPLAFDRWEQVAGAGDAGSLVYSFELTGPTTLTNPLVVPYYRDDACLDDGTGDDPVARPWPGEPSTDQRVIDGYAAAAGKDPGDLECTDRQGAHGSHGLHFFFTHDSDNAFVGSPVPLNEIDGTQWQFAVPAEAPTNVGEPYGNVVRARVQPVVVPVP